MATLALVHVVRGKARAVTSNRSIYFVSNRIRLQKN